MENSPSSPQRLLTLTTEGAPLDLTPLEFRAKEKISDIPCYEILVTHGDSPLDVNALAQQTICLTLALPNTPAQYYHGDVVEVEPECRKGWPLLVWLRLKPRIHRLRHQHNSQPFIKKTAQQIAALRLDSDTWANAKFAKQQYRYEEINYYVQHEENHLQFIDRLLREQGFFFYFTSHKSGHTLVIADNSFTTPKLPTPLIYDPNTVDAPHVMDVRELTGQELPAAQARGIKLKSRWVGRPFDTLVKCKETQFRDKSGKHYTEHYTPGFLTPKQSQVIVDQAVDAINWGKRSVALKTTYPNLHAGVHFVLQSADSGWQPRHANLWAHTVLHHAHDYSLIANDCDWQDKAEAVQGYHNIVVRAGHSECPFRPQHPWFEVPTYTDNAFKITQSLIDSDPFTKEDAALHSEYSLYHPDPFIAKMNQFIEYSKRPLQYHWGWRYAPGLHPAIVTKVGGDTPGKQRHVGEIQVRFKWDHVTPEGKQASPWLKVLQPYAGQQHGHVFMPREGDEVLVGYADLEDPQPIMTAMASVYNGENRPPFKLPENQYVSGIKTRIEGGGPESGHSVKFDDTPGKESISVHVDGDFHESAGGNEDVDVRHGDYIVKVGGDQHIHTKGVATIASSKEVRFATKGGETELVLNSSGIAMRTAGRIHVKKTAPLEGMAGTAPLESIPTHLRKTYLKNKEIPLYKALPVLPRWRQIMGAEDHNDAKSIVRLPAELRKQVYDAIAATYSPSALASVGKDLKEQQQLGLHFEKEIQLPKDLSKWRQIIADQEVAEAGKEQSLQQCCETIAQQRAQKKTLDPEKSLLKKIDAALALSARPTLRDGWLYVFAQSEGEAQYYLFAEYQVQGGECKDIDLAQYAGLDERPATGPIHDFILLPFEDQKNRNVSTKVCFSGVQWSWPRIEYFGGMNPQDKRLQKATQDTKIKQRIAKCQAAKHVNQSETAKARFGEPMRVLDWVNLAEYDIDVGRDQATLVSAIVVLPREKFTDVAALSKTDEQTAAQYDLIRTQDAEIPTLLLNDPLGMNMVAQSDFMYCRQNLLTTIGNLAELPSFTGREGQNNALEFNTTLLAYQLFYNLEMEGVSEQWSATSGFQQDYTGNASVFPNAAKQYLDRDKFEWRLRVKDREVLHWLMHQQQQWMVDALEYQPKHAWDVEVNECIKDFFARHASGRLKAYSAFLGIVNFACLDTYSIDNGLTVDHQYINRLEISGEGKYKQAAEVNYYRLGELMMEEKIEHSFLLFPRKRTCRLFPRHPRAGLAYLHHIHQPDSALYTVLFPKAAAGSTIDADDAPYYAGQGDFWANALAQIKEENLQETTASQKTAIRNLTKRVVQLYLQSLPIFVHLINASATAVAKDTSTLIKTIDELNKPYQNLATYCYTAFADNSIHMGEINTQHVSLAEILAEDSEFARKMEDNFKAQADKDPCYVVMDEHQEMQVVSKEAAEQYVTQEEHDLPKRPRLVGARDLLKNMQDNTVKIGLKGLLAAFALQSCYQDLLAMQDLDRNPAALIHECVYLQAAISGVKDVLELIAGESALKSWLSRYQFTNQLFIEEFAVKGLRMTAFEAWGLLGSVATLFFSLKDFVQSIGKGNPYLSWSSGVATIGNSMMLSASILANSANFETYLEVANDQLADFMGSGQVFGDISVSGDSIAIDGVENLEILASEALGTIEIPVLNVIMCAGLACNIIALIILITQPNKYDKWAKNSPYQIDDNNDHYDSQKLYGTLINLIFKPEEKINYSRDEQRLIVDIYKPSINLLSKVTIDIKSAWSLTRIEQPPYGDLARMYPDFSKPSVDYQYELANYKKIHPIILTGSNMIVGYRFIYSICSNEIEIKLIKNMAENFRTTNNSKDLLHLNNFSGTYTGGPGNVSFSLQFVARSRLTSNQVNIPYSSEKKNQSRHSKDLSSTLSFTNNSGWIIKQIDYKMIDISMIESKIK